LIYQYTKDLHAALKAYQSVKSPTIFTIPADFEALPAAFEDATTKKLELECKEEHSEEQKRSTVLLQTSDSLPCGFR
jgi:hypothetical protein